MNDLSRAYNEHITAVAADERCDSATIDPHKMGYIPYPAGQSPQRSVKISQLLLVLIGGTHQVVQEPSVRVTVWKAGWC